MYLPEFITILNSVFFTKVSAHILRIYAQVNIISHGVNNVWPCAAFHAKPIPYDEMLRLLFMGKHTTREEKKEK